MKLPAPIATAGLSGILAVAAGMIGYFEGRSLFAYLDPVGIPTICEGVTRGVRLGDRATPQECDARLAEEVRRHARVVDRYVRVPVGPNTYASLVSFVYNVGEGNFARSTLLRRLNAGDRVGACNEMLKWVYAKGRKLPGLVTRRQTERALCLA
jgi:lysozyme